jgi:hypothetical protein
MQTEAEVLAEIGNNVQFYTGEILRKSSLISTSNINRYCNFDAVISHGNRYLGVIEVKPYHKTYDQLIIFPLQLCKLHLAKKGVPFMLAIKCRCGTILMYKFKRSHLKKFEISEVAGYMHGEVDSDELFFIIPKSYFQVLRDTSSHFVKFRVQDDHRPIIENALMERVPVIRNIPISI